MVILAEHQCKPLLKPYPVGTSSHAHGTCQDGTWRQSLVFHIPTFRLFRLCPLLCPPAPSRHSSLLPHSHMCLSSRIASPSLIPSIHISKHKHAYSDVIRLKSCGPVTSPDGLGMNNLPPPSPSLSLGERMIRLRVSAWARLASPISAGFRRTSRDSTCIYRPQPVLKRIPIGTPTNTRIPRKRPRFPPGQAPLWNQPVSGSHELLHAASAQRGLVRDSASGANQEGHSE